jgi:hypothetical protein
MANRDFRIPHSAVSSDTSSGQYWWALVEPLWPKTDMEDTPQHLELATPGQRAVYATMLFVREVNNGGIQQAFWNLPPWLIDLVQEGFERIHANTHLVTIQHGLRAFFGDHPPNEISRRREIVDAATKDWIETQIEPLNKRLYGEEQLRPYWQRYIDAHESEFVD